MPNPEYEISQKITSEAAPKRERMSEKEMGILLAGPGNHEGIALLTGLMNRGESYDEDRLYSLIISKPGVKKIWNKMYKSIPAEWCEGSLIPSKIVVVNREGKYEKTEYGNDKGDAWSGYSLAFSEAHPETSSYQLLGSTSAPSTKQKDIETHAEETEPKLRAPLTRFRIFKEIVKDGCTFPIREVDLLRALIQEYPDDYSNASKKTIRTHLENLSRNNVIIYDSVESDIGFLRYKISDEHVDEPVPTYGRPTLTKRIINVLSSQVNESLSTTEIYERLRDAYPDDYGNLSYSAFTKRISFISNALQRDGYVIKDSEFENKRQSRIDITDPQRQTLRAFVDLVEEFMELDSSFLEEGRKKLRGIISDDERFSALLSKAREASPHAKQAAIMETASKIESVIPRGKNISRREMQVLLLVQGIHLSSRQVTRALKYIRENSREVQVTKKGNTYRYSKSEFQTQFAESDVVFEK